MIRSHLNLNDHTSFIVGRQLVIINQVVVSSTDLSHLDLINLDQLISI